MPINPELDSSHPAVAERINLLLAYYSRDLTGENTLLSQGWLTIPGEPGFMRILGGSGTPFVHYELYVTPCEGRWIPAHGSVAMEPADTAQAAAIRVMDYWHSLDFRDRLKSDVYRELVALSQDEAAQSNGPDRPRPTGS